MAKIEADFFHFDPDMFFKLDLNQYSNEALREMAYFIWTMYPDEPDLLSWRKEKLLPLIFIDDYVYLADDDNEDDDSGDDED